MTQDYSPTHYRIYLLSVWHEGNIGGSLIVDPRGIVLNHGTSANQIVKAQVQLILSRCKEALPKTDLILHRRPETYEKLIAPVSA